MADKAKAFIAAQVPPETHNKLFALAKLEDRSASAVIRQCLDFYIRKNRLVSKVKREVNKMPPKVSQK